VSQARLTAGACICPNRQPANGQQCRRRAAVEGPEGAMMIGGQARRGRKTALSGKPVRYRRSEMWVRTIG